MRNPVGFGGRGLPKVHVKRGGNPGMFYRDDRLASDAYERREFMRQAALRDEVLEYRYIHVQCLSS